MIIEKTCQILNVVNVQSDEAQLALLLLTTFYVM